MKVKLTPTATIRHKTKARIKEHGSIADVRSTEEVVLNAGNDAWFAVFPDGHSRWIEKHEVTVEAYS